MMHQLHPQWPSSGWLTRHVSRPRTREGLRTAVGITWIWRAVATLVILVYSHNLHFIGIEFWSYPIDAISRRHRKADQEDDTYAWRMRKVVYRSWYVYVVVAVSQIFKGNLGGPFVCVFYLLTKNKSLIDSRRPC